MAGSFQLGRSTSMRRSWTSTLCHHANGESYSPIVVQAQGVEATLGDRKLDTGMIGVAEDPICYIIALDNSTHRRRGFP